MESAIDVLPIVHAATRNIRTVTSRQLGLEWYVDRSESDFRGSLEQSGAYGGLQRPNKRHLWTFEGIVNPRNPKYDLAADASNVLRISVGRGGEERSEGRRSRHTILC